VPVALLDTLRQWDLRLLYVLNVMIANPGLDQFWDGITHMHKQLWVQLGLLPLVVMYLLYIYRMHAFKVLAVLALTVALTDTLCYRVIKQAVPRARPFENQEISSWLRKVGDAHGPSFPSNHAANCFAGAAILAWYFRRRRFYFYTFATLVALSRPALGVHYPSDVLGGAIVGLFVAWLVEILLLNHIRFFRLPVRVSEEDIQSDDWRLRSRRLSQP
jgi:undecaprenyl-diphosphatase